MKIIPLHLEKPGKVSVNGVEIPSDVIAAEAQNHPMPKGQAAWAWQAAAHALVCRQVLLQEAQRQYIQAQPIELEQGIWETPEEALIRQLLEKEIKPALVDNEALLKIYNQYPSRFRGPSLYEAAHILFSAPVENTAARAAARKQAQALITELNKKPRYFAAAAAKYSACPSKSNGGLLGQLASGDTVPEFEAALAVMPQGSISAEPLETRYGFHIVRLDARVKGEALPFESVQDRLKQAQEKVEWVKSSRAYMHQLLGKAQVKGIDIQDTPWTHAA